MIGSSTSFISQAKNVNRLGIVAQISHSPPQTVAADNIIQECEAELLRAIAHALDCPIPPFVSMPQGATAA